MPRRHFTFDGKKLRSRSIERWSGSALRATDESGTADAYAAKVLADGPTVYWRLNNTLADSGAAPAAPLVISGTGNNASFTTAKLVHDNTHSLRFDGDRDRAQTDFASQPSFDKVAGSGPISFELIFKADSIVNDSNYLVDFNTSSTGGTGMSLYFFNNTAIGAVDLISNWDRPDSSFDQLRANGMDPTKKNHVVVTCDGTSRIRMFLNGELIQEKPYAGPWNVVSGQPNIFVGAWQLDTLFDTANSGWPGNLSDLAIYRKELTPQRVLAHYLASSSAAPTG